MFNLLGFDFAKINNIESHRCILQAYIFTASDHTIFMSRKALSELCNK